MFEDDEKDEFFFRWQIKNFSFATNKPGEAIHSPTICSEILDDTKWYLSIYPRGKEDAEFVDIYLTRCDSDGGGSHIPIIFTIELEAADSSRQERRVSLKSIFERKSSFGFDQYIRRRTLLEDMKSTFLPDDILTIHCTFERAPSNVQYVKEYIVESYVEKIEKEVPWTIEDWSNFHNFNFIYKDVVYTGEYEATFRFFICERDNAEKKRVVGLKMLHSNRKCTPVTCCISVVDAKGSENLVRTTYHRFGDKFEMNYKEIDCLEDIEDSYLKDGVLSLRCILKMETDQRMQKMSEKTHELEKDEDEDLDKYIEEELVRDYENLFLSGDFSDVKLRAGSKVVDCHKSILYARSQVISDLLDQAEESSKDGGDCVIDIYDLDGDTLEKMIYFMYSDKIKNMNLASGLKLFVAGHNYKISYLKHKCSLYLSKILNFENIYDILIAAHRYRDGCLKSYAIGYISEYFSRICLTTEWENFRKTEKDLAAYVCREIRRIKHV